nr:MAG TPA: hypothetical protein [Caudoviricetes sp.]
MQDFFRNLGKFWADNWKTILLSAATTIVMRLLLCLL